MSFADALGRSGGGVSSSGGGYGTSSGGGGDDAFAAESRAVASAIFQMTTNVTSFKRLVDALGTPKDTRDLRLRLHRQRDALGQIAKDTTAAVKRLSELASSGGPTAKATQTKLVKDFQAVLKEFQKAQRVCAERESAYLPQGADRAPPGPFDGVVTGSYQRSESIEKQALLTETKRLEVLQLDGEIDYNNALIEEREAGIAEIQSQIGEVNEIFQDLAVLVNEQGTMIDDIEANIIRTSAKTKEAKGELIKADGHQRSARNKLLWLLLVFAGILGIMLVFIIPWGKN